MFKMIMTIIIMMTTMMLTMTMRLLLIDDHHHHHHEEEEEEDKGEEGEEAMMVIRPGRQRGQGLSSLPPLVVGRKTLVAAGHVTTQNLSGKKICWIGGVAEYLVCS